MRHLRQQDAVNMDRLSKLQITLIGAGSIGSTTAVWLGKMGICNLTVFDDDQVEEHNWSNQLYRDEDIGKSKVTALSEVMYSFSSFEPTVQCSRYADSPLTEVTISCVDSMSSRKTIWQSVRKQSSVQLYIDARMGLETLLVYAVHPGERSERMKYAQSLYSDINAVQEPCTARTICYTPLMASAVICNLVKRYANCEGMPGQIICDLATYTMMKLPYS